MNWNDLQTVLAIAECGSIRAAAKQLGVSHVTVSRHLSEMEDQLAVRLFDRVHGGYIPTGAGEEMVDTARRMRAEVEDVSRKITGRDRALTGAVRVAVPGFLVDGLLMPELAKFRSRFSNIEIELVSGYEAVFLSKREADVAVRLCKSPDGDLVGDRIAEMAFAVYGCEADVKALKQGKPLSVIGEDDGRQVPVWWPAKNRDFVRTMRTNDPDHTYRAIKAGLGVGRIACCVGDLDPDLCRMPLPFEISKTGLWLLTHRDLQRTARIVAFIGFLRDALSTKTALIEGVKNRSG